jgi:outer membrane PBP1 activator LpoA protein
MRLYHLSRTILILSLATSLAACIGSNSGTVSKNPVAVPTELYVAPVDANAAADSGRGPEQHQSSSPAGDPALMNQLTSIDNEINSGKYETAQQQLMQLTPVLTANPTFKTNLIILQTKLALLTGNPNQAMIWLNQLDLTQLPNSAQQHYLMQLRIQALYRTNQVLLSAMANIEDNSDSHTIWNKLQILNTDDLKIPQATQNEALTSGWLTLAQISQRNANNFSALQRNILLWKNTYPQHPANELLVNMNSNIEKQSNNSSIAVIIPLSGNYATFGQFVQKGILSAYYASPAKENQKINFYDSNADSISNIYHRIQQNGETLILGPLTKKDTEDLFSIAASYPRIISLNYTPMNSQTTHFQFGLSPEDEAQQTAELAWRYGKSQAIIIAPKTVKGEQTAQAFMQTWRALGGQIVDQYNYASNDDFPKSMSALLGVTESKWRQHLLHTTLQLRITSTPYFRKDADMMFLVADPKTASQIRPFIKFYSGSYLSVFSTSSVYSGTLNPNNDKDLNDIYFCDMPAILRQTSNQFQGDKRLYFLGKDAYLLAMQQPHLDTLPRFPLFGNTGNLTVDTTHHLQRELICAQFKDGRPIPLGSTSEGAGS